MVVPPEIGPTRGSIESSRHCPEVSGAGIGVVVGVVGEIGAVVAGEPGLVVPGAAGAVVGVLGACGVVVPGAGGVVTPVGTVVSFIGWVVTVGLPTPPPVPPAGNVVDTCGRVLFEPPVPPLPPPTGVVVPGAGVVVVVPPVPPPLPGLVVTGDVVIGFEGTTVVVTEPSPPAGVSETER